jgi:hypothetical protein
MISIGRVKSAYEKTRDSNSHDCVPLHNGGDIRILYNIVNFTFLFSFEEARRREVRVCSDEGRHPRYLMKNKDTLDISCSSSVVTRHFSCSMCDASSLTDSYFLVKATLNCLLNLLNRYLIYCTPLKVVSNGTGGGV